MAAYLIQRCSGFAACFCLESRWSCESVGQWIHKALLTCNVSRRRYSLVSAAGFLTHPTISIHHAQQHFDFSSSINWALMMDLKPFLDYGVMIFSGGANCYGTVWYSDFLTHVLSYLLAKAHNVQDLIFFAGNSLPLQGSTRQIHVFPGGLLLNPCK